APTAVTWSTLVNVHATNGDYAAAWRCIDRLCQSQPPLRMEQSALTGLLRAYGRAAAAGRLTAEEAASAVDRCMALGREHTIRFDVRATTAALQVFAELGDAVGMQRHWR